MLKRTAFITVFLVLGTLALGVSSYAATLWYNGDMDNYSGLANEINTPRSPAVVYDDFEVGAGGWLINEIWSNNLITFTGVTQALWEIRSGISGGNGGTVISGGVSPATQAPTGRVLTTTNGIPVYTEYTIDVSGLNITLDPGTYWLSVAPIGFGTGNNNDNAFVSTTKGLNAIGVPAGDNGSSFFNSSYFGYLFTPAGDIIPGAHDFSMGVAGAAGAGIVPEPATVSLLGLGLLGLAFKRKRTA